jgi:hypothetical protein
MRAVTSRNPRDPASSSTHTANARLCSPTLSSVSAKSYSKARPESAVAGGASTGVQLLPVSATGSPSNSVGGRKDRRWTGE